MNRSVTVIVAVKMLLDNLTLKESFEEVKRRRPQASPFNDNRLELLKFEKKIRGCNSISFEEFSKLTCARAATLSAPLAATSPPSPTIPRSKSAFSFPLLCPGMLPACLTTAPAALQGKEPKDKHEEMEKESATNKANADCDDDAAAALVTQSASYADFATISDEPSTPTSSTVDGDPWEF